MARVDGPIGYDLFRQRVRRHRRTDVLLAVANLNAHLQRAESGQEPPPPLPNFVTPFSLAGIARTALICGNDYRDRAVLMSDLIEMCSHYANIDEPAFAHDASRERLRWTMNHMAYEQFGHQFSAMENVGRTLALLIDHSHASQQAPTPQAWRERLGVSLELFLQLGFAMHVAALSNDGLIDPAVLRMDHVAPIFAPLTPDAALELIGLWFSATLVELQAAGMAEETRGIEKWGLSPLVAKPIVVLSDGRYVIPWPRLLLDRISPTGIYFIGIETFGSSFTDGLGSMFESYVGTQLRLLRHADVVDEIRYGKSMERTVDYFVITTELVLLVEVKSARPVRATRQGEPLGDADTAKKLGHAFGQIDRTARLVREAHPAVASIPTDRPIRGIVVTLEPFYLVNTSLYDDVFERPTTPTIVVSSHDLEGTVAGLQDSPDVGKRLLDALTPDDGAVAQIRTAADGLPTVGNPILLEAWDRFCRPWGIDFEVEEIA
jgi:hypothetical protein